MRPFPERPEKMTELASSVELLDPDLQNVIQIWTEERAAREATYPDQPGVRGALLRFGARWAINEFDAFALAEVNEQQVAQRGTTLQINTMEDVNGR